MSTNRTRSPPHTLLQKEPRFGVCPRPGVPSPPPPHDRSQDVQLSTVTEGPGWGRLCDDNDGCLGARPWIERTAVPPEGMSDQWQELLGGGWVTGGFGSGCVDKGCGGVGWEEWQKQ